MVAAALVTAPRQRPMIKPSAKRMLTLMKCSWAGLAERDRSVSPAQIPCQRKKNRRCNQRSERVLEVNSGRARIESREEAGQCIGGYQEISDTGRQKHETQ